MGRRKYSVKRNKRIRSKQVGRRSKRTMRKRIRNKRGGGLPSDWKRPEGQKEKKKVDIDLAEAVEDSNVDRIKTAIAAGADPLDKRVKNRIKKYLKKKPGGKFEDQERKTFNLIYDYNEGRDGAYARPSWWRHEQAGTRKGCVRKKHSLCNPLGSSVELNNLAFWKKQKRGSAGNAYQFRVKDGDDEWCCNGDQISLNKLEDLWRQYTGQEALPRGDAFGTQLGDAALSGTAAVASAAYKALPARPRMSDPAGRLGAAAVAGVPGLKVYDHFYPDEEESEEEPEESEESEEAEKEKTVRTACVARPMLGCNLLGKYHTPRKKKGQDKCCTK